LKSLQLKWGKKKCQSNFVLRLRHTTTSPKREDKQLSIVMSNKIPRTFEVASNWFWEENFDLTFIWKQFNYYQNGKHTTVCVTTSYFHVDLSQPSRFHKISACRLWLAPTSSTLDSHLTESPRISLGESQTLPDLEYFTWNRTAPFGTILGSKLAPSSPN